MCLKIEKDETLVVQPIPSQEEEAAQKRRNATTSVGLDTLLCWLCFVLRFKSKASQLFLLQQILGDKDAVEEEHGISQSFAHLPAGQMDAEHEDEQHRAQH